jgi:hypothetical protein
VSSRLLALWLVGLMLLPACGRHRALKASGAEGDFRISEPGDGWVWVRPGGADRAWYHEERMATIYVDSNCNRRHVDNQLSDAMRHLTAGLTLGEPERQEALRLDGRDALLRVYNVTLDGIALRMGVVVLNKDVCTYDMVYLAPSRRFEDGWADFVQIVSGFQVF